MYRYTYLHIYIFIMGSYLVVQLRKQVFPHYCISASTLNKSSGFFVVVVELYMWIYLVWHLSAKPTYYHVVRMLDKNTDIWKTHFPNGKYSMTHKVWLVIQQWMACHSYHLYKAWVFSTYRGRSQVAVNFEFIILHGYLHKHIALRFQSTISNR